MTSPFRSSRRGLTPAVLAGALLFSAAPLAGADPPPGPGTLERVSLSTSGAQRNALPAGSTTACSVEATNGACTKRTVSDDGNVVVFSSRAANLVPGDTNGVADVFVWRRIPSAGQAQVVSPTVGGDDHSSFATVSPNGAWVAFESRASNLPPGDGALGFTDIYVYRLSTAQMYRVNVPTDAGQRPDNNSVSPSVADDGTVAFGSFASNLVLPQSNRGFQQVYVNRNPTGGGRAELVSVDGSGQAGQGPGKEAWIDAAGKTIVFTAFAALDANEDVTNSEDDIFVRKLGSGLADATTGRITKDAGARTPSISPDGAKVAFAAEVPLTSDDPDLLWDVYTASATGGNVSMASRCVACSEITDRPAVVPSVATGGTVAFQSAARFVAGVTTEQVWTGSGPRLVSGTGAGPTEHMADAPAGAASISGDGRFVAFTSAATNLVSDDYNIADDVFLWDGGDGSVIRVSVGPGGAGAAGFALQPPNPPALSADGRTVAFESDSSNLVPGDANGASDVFVRAGGVTNAVSVGFSGAAANGPSFGPSLSADGRLVVFESRASNLVSGGDTNEAGDVYLHDRATGVTTRVSIPPYGERAGVVSGNPSISPNGVWVAFESTDRLTPVDNTATSSIYRCETATGLCELVTRSGDNPTQAQSRPSYDPSVADDGSVAFMSRARNWTVPPEAGGTPQASADDIFVIRRDLTVIQASVDDSGVGGDDDSYEPAISADGNHVAFSSLANNLAGPVNAEPDVFVRHRPPARPGWSARACPAWPPTGRRPPRPSPPTVRSWRSLRRRRTLLPATPTRIRCSSPTCLAVA